MKKVMIKKSWMCSILFFVFGGSRACDDSFIISENYRAISQHILDLNHTINVEKIKYGDIIFVLTEYLRFFVNIHKKIPHPYILLTHDSDISVPGNYEKLLDDEKLLHWFGENPNIKHKKLTPVPLGVVQFSHLINTPYEKLYYDILKHGPFGHTKKYNVLCNFALKTYPQERSQVYALFNNKPYVYVHYTGGDVQSYLGDLKQSRFVLSPRGGGLDCHRTWEALSLGCIPIVMTSLINELFEDLPVLIIESWKKVNKALLDKTFKDYSLKKFNYQKLHFAYWKKLILDKQTQLRRLVKE